MKILWGLAIAMLGALVSITGWADNSGLPNFQQVTNNIYRGGRPGNGDVQWLNSNRGVEAIIDLEDVLNAIDSERVQAKDLGMGFFSSEMNPTIRPADTQVTQILAQLKNAKSPIYVHCLHGQDRTGLIIGLYRVEVQGWTPDRAYQEMLALGFHTKYAALDQYFRDRTGM